MEEDVHLLRLSGKHGRRRAMTTPQVPQIFDHRKASAKWARALDRQRREGSADYLYRTIAEDIAERLDFMRLEPAEALVVGDVTGTLQSHLDSIGSQGETGLLGEFDEERPGPMETFDLVAHLMGLGMVNDLPGALIHARHSLREGGLFIAAFPGAGSLPALRRIALAADGEQPAARMHPLVDNRAGTALLERAGFARKVVDTYPLKVRFSSLGQLICDLRDHGLTRSLASPVPALSREWLARAQAEFEAMREADGKVTETFEILVLTGWR
jgi:SAM-dependent methyltransferase